MNAVFITKKEDVVICGVGGQGMEKSNHEEADTRIVLHVMHCLRRGSIINVRTVDSDVVAILLGNYNQFRLLRSGFAMELETIFVRFASTQFTKHSTFPTLIPLLVAVSGCDTVSSFKGVSKKKFLNALKKSAEDDIEGLRQAVATPFKIQDSRSRTNRTRYIALIE